jgi:hypothetical protein
MVPMVYYSQILFLHSLWIIYTSNNFSHVFYTYDSFCVKKMKPFIEMKLSFKFIPKVDHIYMIYKFAHIYIILIMSMKFISSKCKIK